MQRRRWGQGLTTALAVVCGSACADGDSRDGFDSGLGPGGAATGGPTADDDGAGETAIADDGGSTEPDGANDNDSDNDSDNDNDDSPTDGADGDDNAPADSDGDGGEPPNPFAPTPTGCVSTVAAGVHDFTCDGLVTTVTIPSVCLETPCGVIVDIHGASMDADQQDANTTMRALGAEHGYIVVQPTTDGFSWSAGHEHRIMTGVFDVIDAMDADDARIHVTGFSAGGGATWVIVCEYADVFASAAPAAATGQYLGAAPVCFGSSPPNPQLDILYINGLTDPFETMDYVDQLVGKIIADWAMGPGVSIEGDGNFDRVRHENANGTAFELLTHTYETDEVVGVPPLGTALGGHCYPGSLDHSVTLPGQLAGYGCKGSNGFHYGQTVLQFFVDHPK